MRRIGLCAVLVVACGGLLGTGAMRAARAAGGAVAPARKDPFPELPGKAIGLIVLPGREPWGTFYEPGFDWAWAGSEKDTTYRFLVGERTEYAPYFSPASPIRTPFGLRVELPAGPTSYTVDMAAGAKALAAKAHGIRAAVHLVEVEVNGGRGGRGPHFVITGARILDGTSALPLSLEEKLGEARRAFDAAVARMGGAIARDLEAAGKDVRAGAGKRFVRASPMDVEQVVYRPVWVEASRRVEVTFAYRRVRAWIVKSGPPRPYTKGAPPPPELTARYSAGVALRYRLGEGAPVEVETFGPMVLEPAIPFHHVPWDPDGLP